MWALTRKLYISSQFLEFINLEENEIIGDDWFKDIFPWREFNFENILSQKHLCILCWKKNFDQVL
jgi:hypothetical protein